MLSHRTNQYNTSRTMPRPAKAGRRQFLPRTRLSGHVASTLLLLAGFLILNGCASNPNAEATRAYLIASETYIAASDGLTDARAAGGIGNDEWADIRETARALKKALDTWKGLLDTGTYTPEPREVTAVLRDLVTIYVRIYGRQP